MHLAPGFGNAFANLHNAREAQSGIVHIIAEHADYHLRFEAPLKADTVGISEAISHWPRVTSEPRAVVADGSAAVQAARGKSGQIATLIEAEGATAASPPVPLRRPSSNEVKAAAKALREPDVIFLVDGAALWSDLGLLAKLAPKAAGAAVVCRPVPARGRHGADRADGLRNRGQHGLAGRCAGADLVWNTRPAVFFAYPGKPSTPDSLDTRLIELSGRDMDVGWTIAAVDKELGEAELEPADFVPTDLPALPRGAMRLEAVARQWWRWCRKMRCWWTRGCHLRAF